MRFLVLLLGLLGSVLSPLSAAEQSIFFLIGENEYQTARTLPAFAKAELKTRGLRCTFSILDELGSFPNFSALREADLLFISVRRQRPSAEQMEALRAHVTSGKPVIGIRTASHAFGKRKGETEGAWENFDMEVLGGDYENHYGKGLKTLGKVLPEAANHPIVAGLGTAEFDLPSHLYRYPRLAPTVTRLLTARLDGRPEVEPIAWVNTAQNRRVFYCSLGSEEDFALPQFRRLLLNAIWWTLQRPPLP